MSASKLTIELENLIMALDGHGPHTGWYLDRMTGAVAYSTRDQFATDHPDYFDPEAQPERYLHIAPRAADEARGDIKRFIDSLSDADQRRTLSGALASPTPFSAFKDALRAYPESGDAWLGEHENKMVEIAMRWLEDQRIGATLS